MDFQRRRIPRILSLKEERMRKVKEQKQPPPHGSSTKRRGDGGPSTPPPVEDVFPGNRPFIQRVVTASVGTSTNDLKFEPSQLIRHHDGLVPENMEKSSIFQIFMKIVYLNFELFAAIFSNSYVLLFFNFLFGAAFGIAAVAIYQNIFNWLFIALKYFILHVPLSVLFIINFLIQQLKFIFSYCYYIFWLEMVNLIVFSSTFLYGFICAKIKETKEKRTFQIQQQKLEAIQSQHEIIDAAEKFSEKFIFRSSHEQYLYNCYVFHLKNSPRLH